MSGRTAALALGLVMVLGGCADAVRVADFYDADSATLRRFEAMEVVAATDMPPAGYRDLGVVEGLYCHRVYGAASVDDPLARAQAIDQVMLKAANKGATRISTPECVVSSAGSFANNCLGTVTCASHALRAEGE